MSKVVKLGKKDDLVSAIQQIKNLNEREIIFELEKGSRLLSSSANLKLLRRTGETLKKKVTITTDDPVGKLLAIKAGVLAGYSEADVKNMMPKRQTKSSSKKSFSDVGVKKARVLPAATISELKSNKARRFSGSTIKKSIAAAAVTLIVLVLASVLLPQAQITIYARSESIDRDAELKVDQNATAANYSTLTIPGKIYSKEVSKTGDFKATGSSFSGSKAAGKIQIYNGTGNTLTLKASTTTLLFEGKKYFFTKDVTGIKPTTSQSNSNPLVDIVAEQPGEGYNLASDTKLTISNAALGNRPEVYGLTSGPISGGQATAKTVLSQADLDQALGKITADLISEAQAELDSETPGTRLLPSGVEKEILASTADKEVGDEAESFSMTVIARIKGLTFNENDATSLMDQQIKSVLADDKYIVDGSTKVIQAEFKDKDLNLGQGTLEVHYSRIIAYKVETENLKRILSGKKTSEIKEILLSKPEVDQIEVKLSPFFVRKAPKYNGKIYINTVLTKL
ncbi:MAG: hypothetical protein HYV13_01210 [Candidatus Doudnabacteria bacterium]|nr:hypothetical protein [Candidatus Doudnabacteria bacterium]